MNRILLFLLVFWSAAATAQNTQKITILDTLRSKKVNTQKLQLKYDSIKYTSDTSYLVINSDGTIGRRGSGTIVTTVAGINGLTNSQINIPIITTDLRGGTWIDAGINDGTYADNGATIKITSDNHVKKRIYSGLQDITWYGVLTTNTASQNNAAIKALISTLPSWSTLFVPTGTYLFDTTIVLTKPINFTGESATASILKNVGSGRNFFKFSDNIERFNFTNIGIFGNGTQPFGTDATTGKGFVFGANTVHITFDNVWMRGHGDHFFFADSVGSVNNIIINDCKLEYGKKSAIHMIQSDFNNQINAIYITKNNISGFAENNVEYWGSASSIKQNTIQASRKRGVSIDAFLGHASSSARGNSVEDNYFELCDMGNIYARAFVDNLSQYRYIEALSIKNNYGTYGQNPGATANPLNYSAVEIDAPSFYSVDNAQVSAITYENNAFYLGQTSNALLEAHNVLTNNSNIQKSGDLTKYLNLGQANIFGDPVVRRTQVEINAISTPKNGDLIFNTTAKKYQVYLTDSLKFVDLVGISSQWISGVDGNGNPKVAYNGSVEINGSIGNALSVTTNAGKYTLGGNTLNAPGAFIIRSNAAGYAQLRDDYADVTLSNGTVSLNQNTGTKTSVVLDNGVIKFLINNLEFLRMQSANATFYGKTVSGARATQDTMFTTRGQVTDTLNARFGPIAITKKVLSDTNYTVVSYDNTLILPEPTAIRTLTLPAASTMPNKELWIVCRSLTTGRWVLSGSFVQKGTTGSTFTENFVNSGLVTAVTYHLVSDGSKWFDINQ